MNTMRPAIDSIRGFFHKLSAERPAVSSLLSVFAPRPSQPPSTRSHHVLLTLVELLILAAGVVAYCRGILDLGSTRGLPGAESEVFQALDWTLLHAVREDHVFPLWNPFLDTGMPFIADPMLHAYNPLVTIPVLAFGMPDGFKVALALSIFAAAAGMWYLGAALGMSRPVRIGCGLLFAFAGQPAARFFQGQYLFVFGFAWIPWAFAFLLQALRTRRRLYAGLAVVCLALVFFSGNVYYSIYVLLAGVVLVVAYLFHPTRTRPFLRVDVARLKVLALIGVVGFGLVAVQFLPLREFLPRISKSTEVHGSHTLFQVLLDYTSKDRSRPDAYSVLPASEEFYAYLGVGPLLAMLLAPLAWRRGDRRALAFFALLLGLVLLWIGLEYLPWGEWLAGTRLLGQVRHLLRILILGNLAIIVLGGLGLQAVYRWLGEHASGRRTVQAVLARGGQIGVAGFLAFTVFDVFTTNSPILQTQPRHEPAYAVTRWLRDDDPGDFLVLHDPHNAWQDALISNGLTFLNVWYHFDDIHAGVFGPSDHRVVARPHYQIQGSSMPPPADPLAERVYDRDNTSVYRLPGSLPMAFVVGDGSLIDLEHSLTRDEVLPLTPNFLGPNRADVIVDGHTEQVLVLLVTHYPGWQVRVDGIRRPLEDVSGFLATRVLPGVHEYAFTFRPTSFYLGLVISLAMLALVGVWLALDGPWRREDLIRARDSLRQDWQPIQAQWARLTAWLSARGLTRPAGELSPEPGLGEPAPGIRGAARRVMAWAGRLENALLLLSLGVYLAVRLIRLADFPIWFFADEAIQTLLASDFIRDGLRDFHGHLFPTYFLNVYGYNENLTVYVQVIPYLLFGKSVFVTRAVSVLVTAFGALAVGLILRHIFRARLSWAGILLLSCAPAWFLHSRTAFETTHMSSYYAWFLYCYLRYRTGSPRALYPALIFAAATFYTTGAGEIIIAATGLLLLLIDARYHWSQRRLVLRAIPLAVLLVLPYLRFRVQMGGEHTNLLRLFDSYWLRDLPLAEKLRTAIGYYTYAISPGYWFLPNTHDGTRHVMNGYGNLMLWTLPFTLAGVWLALRRIRRPEYRALLVPIVAVPLGGVVVDVGITRILPFVIPASLLAALAIDALATWISTRISRHAVALATFTALAGVNFLLLGDSLVNGPFWNRNYGMEIPWGGPQVFGAVEQWLEDEPDANFYVSPTWANGVDTLQQFFLPAGAPVGIANADRFTERRQPLTDQTILVLTAREYEQARMDPKLADVRVVKLIPYPDGSPGFYFVRMRYSDQADALFEQERQRRLMPVIDTLEVRGETLTIEHPLLDSGGVQHIFDGDPYTLARGYDANPMLLKITFGSPRPLTGIDITTGSMDFALTIRLFPADGRAPAAYSGTYRDLPDDPTVSMDFPGAPDAVSRIELEIQHLLEPGPAKIHLREIRFR